MSDFVWLTYPETGGKAQFPTRSAKAWRAKGWVDCAPPVDSEPHPRDPIAAAPEPTPAPAPERAEPKTASRKRGGETNTAPEEG